MQTNLVPTGVEKELELHYVLVLESSHYLQLSILKMKLMDFRNLIINYSTFTRYSKSLFFFSKIRFNKQLL